MAAAAPLRREEASDLDHRWGWGRYDPATGQRMYNVTGVVRTPMAFEEAGWDKPEHRYTYDQVKAMDRTEFDHRLDLHSIYGNEYTFNTDYIRAKYPDIRDPVRFMLEQAHDNIHDDEQEYKSRWKLRREHVQSGLSRADPHMGDTFTPAEHEAWARQYGDAPRGPGSRELLDPGGGMGDQVYGFFHQRQYDRLLRHGRQRQAEASKFMRKYEQREAMRHAFGAFDRSADLLPGDSGIQDPTGQVGNGTGGHDRGQGGEGTNRMSRPPMQTARMLPPEQSYQSGGGAGIEHRGKSAAQQVIAGSGRLPAPPGYHLMSTGVLMKDLD